MKVLEIRRHSIRRAGEHLSQQGVSLARLVGQNLGPFDRVVTSTLPRAFETAIAMGFAVDEQNELFNTYGPGVEAEVPWPQPYEKYAEALKNDGPAAKYAKKLAKAYAGLMDFLADGRSALVINHGGVVELSVAACLPDVDFTTWGDSVGYCEGARLYWSDGVFRAEELRVKM